MAKQAVKKNGVVNKRLVDKILDLLDAGLTDGLDDKDFNEGQDLTIEEAKGHVCVEAAITLALGEPHGDHPSCVDRALADFKIALNDNGVYNHNKDRGRVLRELAIAQLGTKKNFDFEDFAKRLGEKFNGDAFSKLKAKLAEARSLNEMQDLIDEADLPEFNIDDLELSSRADTVRMAKLAVEVLKEMKTEGSKYLYLTEK